MTSATKVGEPRSIADVDPQLARCMEFTGDLNLRICWHGDPTLYLGKHIQALREQNAAKDARIAELEEELRAK